jgi:hypothetical protein
LEDLGLLPSEELDEGEEVADQPVAMSTEGEKPATDANSSGRETLGGIPWFDTLVEGSRLGNMRTTKGSGRSRDGTVRVEWEVVEFTDDGDETPRSGKRKLDDRDEAGDSNAMDGVEN